MKGKIVLVAIGLVLLLLVACGPKEAPAPVEVIKEPPGKMEKAPPVTETVDREAVAAPDEAQEVSDIESSSVEIEELEEGFDTSVLDQLDLDLAALDNLDLG